MEIIYVLPDLDKIIKKEKTKWCIDYLMIENENSKTNMKHEFFDNKDKAITRYNELVGLSLVKNF